MLHCIMLHKNTRDGDNVLLFVGSIGHMIKFQGQKMWGTKQPQFGFTSMEWMYILIAWTRMVASSHSLFGNFPSKGDLCSLMLWKNLNCSSSTVYLLSYFNFDGSMLHFFLPMFSVNLGSFVQVSWLFKEIGQLELILYELRWTLYFIYDMMKANYFSECFVNLSLIKIFNESFSSLFFFLFFSFCLFKFQIGMKSLLFMQLIQKIVKQVHVW